MPNVNAVINQQIARVAQRVVNASTKSTRKFVAHQRRDVAALKRQVSALLKRLSGLEKRQPKEVAPPPEVIEKARFRADGLKSHRAKLGISAAEYGKLVGVSALTIYHWESGKSRPRKAQIPKIVAVRGLGKREAMARLGVAPAGKAEKAPAQKTPAPRRRGVFGETGSEFILRLVRKPQLTAAINTAWKKAGRAGTADVMLMRMIKDGSLKRSKVKGERGSLYRAA